MFRFSDCEEVRRDDLHTTSQPVKLLIAFTLIAGALPVAADVSPREKAIYLYGFNYGWISAECVAYEDGKLSTQQIASTFEALVEDKDLTDKAKNKIYSVIRETSYTSSCARLLDKIEGEASRASYTL